MQQQRSQQARLRQTCNTANMAVGTSVGCLLWNYKHNMLSA